MANNCYNDDGTMNCIMHCSVIEAKERLVVIEYCWDLFTPFLEEIDKLTKQL